MILCPNAIKRDSITAHSAVFSKRLDVQSLVLVLIQLQEERKAGQPRM